MNDSNNIEHHDLPKNEMDLKDDIQRYINKNEIINVLKNFLFK